MPWRSKYFRFFQRTVFILNSQNVSFEYPSRSFLCLVVVVSRRRAGVARNCVLKFIEQIT